MLQVWQTFYFCAARDFYCPGRSAAAVRAMHLRSAAAAVQPALHGSLAPALTTALTSALRLRGGTFPPLPAITVSHSMMASLTLYLGTVMSSLSGCITAGSKEMDLLGCVCVGLITAVGGGTMRDLVLGRQPFWIEVGGGV